MRDDSFSCLLNEIKGDINSGQGVLIREMLSGFEQDPIDILMRLVPTMIDTTLHYVLDMIDSSDDVKLLFKNEESKYVEIKKLSDGLAGKLYSEDGWISKFSKQPLVLD